MTFAERREEACFQPASQADIGRGLLCFSEKRGECMLLESEASENTCFSASLQEQRGRCRGASRHAHHTELAHGAQRMPLMSRFHAADCLVISRRRYARFHAAHAAPPPPFTPDPARRRRRLRQLPPLLRHTSASFSRQTFLDCRRLRVFAFTCATPPFVISSNECRFSRHRQHALDSI